MIKKCLFVDYFREKSAGIQRHVCFHNVKRIKKNTQNLLVNFAKFNIKRSCATFLAFNGRGRPQVPLVHYSKERAPEWNHQ